VRGAKLICLPNAQGKVDLAGMLHDLASREINELHVEAGATLSGALLAGAWVDELVLYLAPKLIGQGRGMAQFGPLSTLAQALHLEFQSTDMIGPDLRILARVSGRSAV
jgi:diaminohydroxyphosphoribosylaminopyrimidine deaminase/5-amino-6-(5-phosphoribosylamino)uracil reductase